MELLSLYTVTADMSSLLALALRGFYISRISSFNHSMFLALPPHVCLLERGCLIVGPRIYWNTTMCVQGMNALELTGQTYLKVQFGPF
jgi:hypothetical protein